MINVVVKVWRAGENCPFLIMNCYEFNEIDGKLELSHEDVKIVLGEDSWSFYETEEM